MEATAEGERPKGILVRLGPLGRMAGDYLNRQGRRCLLRAAMRLWVWNILAAAAFHLPYIDSAPTSGSAKVWLFLHLGLVSNALVLTLIPALVTVLLALLWPRNSKRSLTGVFTVIWTMVLVAIMVDTQIFAIFHYHFNGMHWALITNPDAGDSLHFSTLDKFISGLKIAAILAAQWFWFGRLLRKAPLGFAPRSKRIFLLALLPIFLVEKGIYAHADLMRDRRVTAVVRVFPLYQPLTVKRLARDRFGFVLEDRPEVDLSGGGIMLNYPISRPVFADSETPRPNIVVIAIDSVRADMLAPETMPHIMRYIDAPSNGARVFQDHYSGGNATRFGIFSMVYGLHGSYWHPMYKENTSPVLVDSLLELEYEMQILSTASMSTPEFRSTAWVRVEENVHDDLEGETPADRDVSLAIAFEDWLTQLESEGKDDAPLFTFAVLDAPHQTYSFHEPPPGETLFEPYMETVNYSQLSKGATPEERVLIKNRYKNSVLHADRVVNDMIESLRAHGELENTILVITADHGEEFWENGFWGHTSNSTQEQAGVPFVMSGPGIEPGVETRATSHIDLAPTLLELIGADSANREDWTLGLNMTALPPAQALVNVPGDPTGYRRRSVAGWSDMGIDTPGGILVVPTQSHRGLVEARTRRWELIMNDDLVDAEAKALFQIIMECSRFLR